MNLQYYQGQLLLRWIGWFKINVKKQISIPSSQITRVWRNFWRFPLHHLWMRGYQGGINNRSQSSCLAWASNSLTGATNRNVTTCMDKYLLSTISIDKKTHYYLTNFSFAQLVSWSVIKGSRKDKDWLKHVACTCHVMRCFRCSFWTKGNGGSSECAWSLKLRTDCTCSNRTLAGTWSKRDLIWNSSAIFWQNKFMKIPGMKFLRMYQLEQGGKVEAQLFW